MDKASANSTINILIVDDKELDRNGVTYLIKQYNLPLNPIPAASANQALEILRSQSVSILLTDIRMPEITGIELIKMTKEISPDLKVVIFSSYGDFDYASEAMDLRVYKYLLKPIKVEKFLACMNELIYEIQEENLQKTSNIYYNVITDGITNDDANILNISQSGYIFFIRFSEPFFNRNQVNLPKSEIDDGYITVPINEYQCAFVSYSETSAISGMNYLLEDLKQYENKFLLIDAGRFNSLLELHEIFNSTEIVIPSFFLTQNTSLKLSEITNSKFVDVEYFMNACSDINKHLLRKEHERANQVIDLMFLKFGAYAVIPTAFVKFICLNILNTQLANNNMQNNELLLNYISEIDLALSITDLKNICISLVQQSSNKEEELKVIDKVLNIIHNRYMENISLEIVAADIYLSGCYLSYLFKKTTGENFIKYLTSYRLEMAKNLLRSTEIKVVVICEMVGYSNISYFCQVFKNHFGMTPAQFRGESL